MAHHRGPAPEVHIRLTRAERKRLRRRVRRYAVPYREVVRARIVLALEKDPCVGAVAARLGVDVKTVRKWRGRFLDGRERGLDDLPRSGRPVRISSVARCQLVGMACGRPPDFGVVDRNVWTLDLLEATFAERFPELGTVGRTSVIRILEKADVRPHRLRPWLHSPDPDFRPKVTEICNLYLEPPSDSVVLCIDEKPVQVLGRRHPSRPPGPHRAGREDYEYIRRGTFQLLAAFDTVTGTVIAECRPTRTAEDLLAFMETIASLTAGYAVHIVWDNLNIHHDGPDRRWTEFNRRHDGRFQFHFTPLHASWVNQVELFFSIVSKRVLRHADFASRDAAMRAVDRFIERWNLDEAHPFLWTFKGYPLQTGRKAA